ncbi:hypothetical protein [Streptomyces sp. NBC_00069]|uniref:hypothetical protein n=1 Tax=Streptomyces sp. NBC_00069 TaxID=2975639 RepID=UPI00386F97CE
MATQRKALTQALRSDGRPVRAADSVRRADGPWASPRRRCGFGCAATTLAPWTDSTVPLLARVYAWLPDRMRATHGRPVRTRLLGRPTIALRGPAAVGFFYDERHIRRTSALPEPVLDTLFGQGAVHTLDGDAHRARKAMFLALLEDEAGVAAPAEHVALQRSEAVTDWGGGRRGVLFDETARILARSICAWAGLRLSDGAARLMAEDCTAMAGSCSARTPKGSTRRRSPTRCGASIPSPRSSAAWPRPT